MSVASKRGDREARPTWQDGAERSAKAPQESCRAIWRNAGFKNLMALAVRHTVADRLYARGADEVQV